jgi:hypothetical protein
MLSFSAEKKSIKVCATQTAQLKQCRRREWELPACLLCGAWTKVPMAAVGHKSNQ